MNVTLGGNLPPGHDALLSIPPESLPPTCKVAFRKDKVFSLLLRLSLLFMKNIQVLIDKSEFGSIHNFKITPIILFSNN